MVDLSSTLIAIIAIGVLIIIHEAGHYLAALLSQMRVSRFSIGFGPALARVRRGETDFQIGVIPLGGFVQIDGLAPNDGSDPTSPASYANRPFHQRFATILAGPAANYALGFLLLFAFYAFFAAEPLAPVRVLRVLSDSAADRAGLKQGDLLVGTSSGAFELAADLPAAIQGSGGRPFALIVERDGQRRTVTLTPDSAVGAFRIGIEFEGTGRRPKSLGVVAGASAALQHVGRSSGLILHSLAALFRPGGREQLSGPIGMVKSLSHRVESSLADALASVADISIMLGMMNLLPIPSLDGSRLLFLLLGLARRKPIDARIEAYVHVGGFVLLLALLIVVSIGDVTR